MTASGIKIEVIATCIKCGRGFSSGVPKEFSIRNNPNPYSKIRTSRAYLGQKIRRHWRKYHKEVN